MNKPILIQHMFIIEEIMVTKKKNPRIFHRKTDRPFYFNEKFFTFSFLWRYSGSLFDLFREKVYGSLKYQAK